MILQFNRYIGLRRIQRGYCPLCRSSPPDLNCYVCTGQRQYGPNMREFIKDIWRQRFHEWLDEEYK